MAETTRTQFENLRDELLASEAVATDEASALFRSEDMKTLMDKLQELKDRGMPGSWFDNVMGSAFNVLGQIREVFVQREATQENLKAQAEKAQTDAAAT